MDFLKLTYVHLLTHALVKALLMIMLSLVNEREDDGKVDTYKFLLQPPTGAKTMFKVSIIWSWEVTEPHIVS